MRRLRTPARESRESRVESREQRPLWTLGSGLWALVFWAFLAPPAFPNPQSQIPNPKSQIPRGAVCRVVNRVGNVQSIGSGTLLGGDRRASVVITCWHIFKQEGPGEILVLFADGPSGYRGRLAGHDVAWDLAAVVIAPPEGRTPAVLAQRWPRPGEAVSFAGFSSGGRYLASAGRVTGYVRTGATRSNHTLQLTGAAREGDSGGPVFNDRGELVAVLWGTDGRTVAGTYCGRVREFLTGVGCCPGRVCPAPRRRPVVPVAPVDVAAEPPDVVEAEPPPLPQAPRPDADEAPPFKPPVVTITPPAIPQSPIPNPQSPIPNPDLAAVRSEIEALRTSLARPFTVRLLDGQGKVIQEQAVRLGGVLQFQLVPRGGK